MCVCACVRGCVRACVQVRSTIFQNCTDLDVAVGTHTHVPVGTVETLGSGEEGSVADDVGVGCACQRAVQIPVVGCLCAVFSTPVVHRGFPEEHVVGVFYLDNE